MDLERPLSDAERSAVRALVARRRAYEPIAYILGRRAFYGHEFEVTPDVLIPRPDSETLISAALEAPFASALDLCTGSGAIAITLAKENTGASVCASDISEAALGVAKRNALSLEAQVEFVLGDLWQPLRGRKFDLIVCNPPYIVDEEVEKLAPDISKYEPTLALAGGADGLDYYRRIAREAAQFVKEGGRLILELGAGQAQAVSALFSGWCSETRKDYGGHERALILRPTR